MKPSLFSVIIFTGVATVFLTEPGAGQSEPSASPSPAKAESSPVHPFSKLLLYKPPADAGNIPTRVSGGARGGGVDVTLYALAPNHVAITTKAQPSLFWFQSKPAKAKFELTLVEPKKPKPLLSLTGPEANNAGIHRIKLDKYKVELQPDVPYEWSVAIVPDAESRSKDVVAKGVIKRIAPSGELTRKLEGASDLDRAAAYARAGVWYDALDTISDAIETHPGDTSLRVQRAVLLQQVGLEEAATFDKKK
jgi:Domain of Unknown Function (DUF928)